MPKSDGSPLDPLPDSAFDGEKYLVEIKPSDHKCKFKRISSNEIRCECGKGYFGPRIDLLIEAFDNR